MLLGRVRTFLGMIKFQHTVFALPFAVLTACFAAFWGEGAEPARFGERMAWILAALVGARTAAMAFNRLMDQKFDAQNPRTAERALPRGLISRPAVWGFTFASIALFVTAAAMLNPLALGLAPVALAVILGYSFTKRFTSLSHFVLGFALAIAPVGAWIAVRGTLHPFPVAVAAGVLFWVAGFDIIYACQDEAFDRNSGLHSIPARLGVARALRLAGFLHALSLAAFLALVPLGGLGVWYLAGWILVAALLVVEHRLVRPDDLGRVNQAFFHVNAAVSAILMVAGLADLFSRR